MSQSTGWGLAVSICLASAGCVNGGPGTKPHAMSIDEHESAAQIEQARADKHAGHHGSGTDLLGVCADSAQARGPCWSSPADIGARHRREHRRHARIAELHRQAAMMLQEEKEEACRSISSSDRERSPVLHGSDLDKVEVYDQAPGVRVVVTYRAVVGLTARRLQGIVDCHLAHSAALGHPILEMPDCPLVPPGVAAEVGQDDSGRVVLTIEAQTVASAEELRLRGQRLGRELQKRSFDARDQVVK